MSHVVGRIVGQFWQGLPPEVRFGINPVNGAYTARIHRMLLRPLVAATSAVALGQYNSTQTTTDPDGLRAALRDQEPCLTVIAARLPVLRIAATTAGRRSFDETLFRIVRAISVLDGTPSELTADEAARLIEEHATPAGSNDPDVAPPSLAGLTALRSDPEALAELEAELEAAWTAPETSRPDPRAKHLEAELLGADRAADWPRLLAAYDELEPWRGLLAAPISAGLTRTEPLRAPRVDGPLVGDEFAPLDRSVVARLHPRLKAGSAGVLDHPRIAGVSTRQLVRLGVADACEPLGLRDPALRSLLALGLAVVREVGQPKGRRLWLVTYLESVVRRVSGISSSWRMDRPLPEAVENTLSDLTPATARRLWSRLYRLDLRDEGPNAGVGTVLSALSAVVEDTVTSGEPIHYAVDEMPERHTPEPDGHVLRQKLALVSCLIADATETPAAPPHDVLRFLRSLVEPGGADVQERHEQHWQDLVAWHQTQHAADGDHPTFPEIRGFVAEHSTVADRAGGQ